MKSEELELQYKRVESGKVLLRKIETLREEYKRVQDSRYLNLWFDRTGGTSKIGYGYSSPGTPDWTLSNTSREEVRDLLELLKEKLLTKLSKTIADLQKQFEDL
jgi:hypothetical protein